MRESKNQIQRGSDGSDFLLAVTQLSSCCLGSRPKFVLLIRIEGTQFRCE